MGVDVRRVEQSAISCDLCNQKSRFCVLAVRVVDGDLLDDASYCRKHALEVALGLGGPWIRFPLSRIGSTLHQCYLDGCDCLPPKLERCERCARLADVWLTAWAEVELLDLDLEGGMHLCAPCAVAKLQGPALPAKVRSLLRYAARRCI